jgi:hypothetical protein
MTRESMQELWTSIQMIKNSIPRERGRSVTVSSTLVAPAAAAPATVAATTTAPAASIAATTTTATVAAAPAAATILTRFCLVNREAASTMFLVVQRVDRCKGIGISRHLDKAKAATAPRLSVFDYLSTSHLAKRREQVFQVGIRDRERKIADV